MKRCPECRRDYYDETLLYCLDDGSELLEGSASADEAATAILTTPTEPVAGSELRESGSEGVRSIYVIPAIVLTLLIATVASWLAWGYFRSGVKTDFGTYIVVPIGVDRPSLVLLTDIFAVAPDGSEIVFVKKGEGLFMRKRNQLVETKVPGVPDDAYAPVFSPDGKWIAFHSNESGRDEIHVVSFPVADVRRQVSVAGGRYPRWSRTSGELFYWQDNTLMAARVNTAGGFRRELPTALFTMTDADPGYERWDVAADGRRFLIAAKNPDAPAREIHVVLNWLATLRAPRSPL